MNFEPIHYVYLLGLFIAIFTDKEDKLLTLICLFAMVGVWKWL